MVTMSTEEFPIELWVDDHQEYETGVVHGHLRHARIAMDPRTGDFVVVGDDEAPAVLAEVIGRETGGAVRLRLLPGRPDAHPQFFTRRLHTAV